MMKDLRGELKQQHSLARYTSWRVGGNAEQFYLPADLADLCVFLQQLPENEALTWLGLGSNVLIRDQGILGTVILTLNRLKAMSTLDQHIIRVEAGVPCAKLARWCAQNGYPDGAFFAGIPGTIGGALAMNAGAFGGETWRQVVAVETVDRQGNIHQRSPDSFQIQYRQVTGLDNQFFVAGHFKFALGDAEGAKLAIKELLDKRNASQPIGSYNCGSVFKNPKGDYAARLIEMSGLKGLEIGQAIVSEKHANFILNQGQAKAADIEQLILYIQEKVQQHFGIRLETEVRILGASISG